MWRGSRQSDLLFGVVLGQSKVQSGPVKEEERIGQSQRPRPAASRLGVR